MSSFSATVYNELDGYSHNQSLDDEYPPSSFQSETYESLMDPRAFNGGLAHYPSSLPSVDHYSDAYSTPNSHAMSLEGHVVEPNIPQALTVQPSETNSYIGPSYYHQPSQSPLPFYTLPPPMPSAFGHNALTWSGPAHLKSSFNEVLNSEQFKTGRALPKNLLIPFLRRVSLPSSPKGRGSRQGAQSHICLWPQCGKELNRRDHGVTHVAGHFGSKPFICGKCHRAFLRIADKRRHVKSTCVKREVSVDSSASNNSGGSSTSGSGSGTELAHPSRYTAQIEVWQSKMGSWLSCLIWFTREAG